MFRFSTLIAPLCLFSLALSGCVDQTPDLEDDDELVGETADALTTSQITSYSASSFELPNGKKVVIVGNVLHAVFRSSGTIKYTSSTDGVTWTAPVTVDSTPARDPSIAVATDGTVMVAYVRNPISFAGTIHIARRPPLSLVFDPPFAITSTADANTSKNPSLVANGTTLHLAWSRATEIKYASFPSTQTSALAAAENVYTTPGSAVYQAAMMVGPGPSGSIARIAFVETRPITPNPPHAPSGGLNLIIRERGVSTWSQVYFDSGTFFSSMQLGSVSADVNPATGDAYVAVSRTIDGAPWTALIHENTQTAGNAFSYNLLYPTTAPLVSVAARTEGCQSRFRVVNSTPFSGHGTADYRTGAWTGGALTWIEGAPVSLPGTSRGGTSLLQSIPIPSSLSSRFFRGTYEEDVGATYSLRDAYDIAPTPIPCN